MLTENFEQFARLSYSQLRGEKVRSGSASNGRAVPA